MTHQGAIEERVSQLEAKMSRLLEEKAEAQPAVFWWEQWFGAFADNPSFDEAMRQGEQYRQSQPNAADNPKSVEP